MAVSSFSEYLKHILKSVNRNTPVPFNEELKYVKSYLELEKLRFDDDLNIIYNIEATDFFVPALSIQPLVENAVKHSFDSEHPSYVHLSFSSLPESCLYTGSWPDLSEGQYGCRLPG